MEIYPSLISSDLLNLAATLSLLDKHCDGYHLDVMDDHFVPNLTWGPAFINAIAQQASRPLNVHLMVDNPEHWVRRLTLSHKDSFIFHWEAFHDVEPVTALASSIRSNGIQAGLALNPKTNVENIKKILTHFDQILIMSVEPGFSGQPFIPEVLSKVTAFAQYKKEQSLSFEIAMDGGINETNINLISSLGVTQCCIASGIFEHKNHIEAIENLYKKCG